MSLNITITEFWILRNTTFEITVPSFIEMTFICKNMPVAVSTNETVSCYYKYVSFRCLFWVTGNQLRLHACKPIAITPTPRHHVEQLTFIKTIQWIKCLQRCKSVRNQVWFQSPQPLTIIDCTLMRGDIELESHQWADLSWGDENINKMLELMNNKNMEKKYLDQAWEFLGRPTIPRSSGKSTKSFHFDYLSF